MKKIKLPYILLLMPLLLCNFSFAEKQMEINIEGITDKQVLENAQNAAEIYSLQGKPAPSDLRIQWLYEEGIKQIAAAMQPYGYYRATIKGDLIYQKEKVIATYNVSPGDQVPIKTLELAVTDLEQLKERNSKTSLSEYQHFAEILSKSKLKVGAPLNHPDYESTKDELSQQASTLGYFDAYYPFHEIIVNLDSYASDINLQMTLGDRYLFGNSTFHQKYFADEFLKRFLHNMRESSDYSDQKLVELQSTFNEANYFEDVVIVPRVNAETKEVPLDIYLRPRKQRTLTLGAGYSSDIGPKIMGGINWHYLNPYGHKLQTNLLYGQKKRDALINYQIPGTDPTQDTYNIFAKYDYENTSTKDYTTYLIGASKDRTREQYKYGFSLHYQYDKFRDISGTKQDSKLLIPTFYGEWKTAPVIPFNQFGLKISGKVRGSLDTFSSDISFIQASIGLHAYIPLGVENRFIVRGTLGNTNIKDHHLNKLPPSLRFYTGGDNSVRGYKYDGIGEKGYNGEIYGGKKLVVASVEYEHKIAPSFAIAGFIDAGDAYNNSVELKYGAGAGIRWYSPIGSVRLDLAHGFDKEFGDTVRLHLNIGLDL